MTEEKKTFLCPHPIRVEHCWHRQGVTAPAAPSAEKERASQLHLICCWCGATKTDIHGPNLPMMG